MKTKNLAMVTFVPNYLKRKVMVQYTYDNNLNQEIEMERKIIPLKRKESFVNLLLKMYPNTFEKTKINGNETYIQKPVFDRMISNLQHTNI